MSRGLRLAALRAAGAPLKISLFLLKESSGFYNVSKEKFIHSKMMKRRIVKTVKKKEKKRKKKKKKKKKKEKKKKAVVIFFFFEAVLLVFSVTPYQNKNRSKPFKSNVQNSGKERGQICRPSPRFRSQQFFLSEICGDIFTQIYRDLYGDADEHQNGGRKPTETSATEVCYKNVNAPLEELKNIKMILFLIHELFR